MVASSPPLPFYLLSLWVPCLQASSELLVRLQLDWASTFSSSSPSASPSSSGPLWETRGHYLLISKSIFRSWKSFFSKSYYGQTTLYYRKSKRKVGIYQKKSFKYSYFLLFKNHENTSSFVPVWQNHDNRCQSVVLYFDNLFRVEFFCCNISLMINYSYFPSSSANPEESFLLQCLFL